MFTELCLAQERLSTEINTVKVDRGKEKDVSSHLAVLGLTITSKLEPARLVPQMSYTNVYLNESGQHR